MRQVKAKLSSRRGASITFALLIFAVCAVVSAVVIVAATTAAGHMSGQADMDQRYYAVAAATEVLRGKLEGGDGFPGQTVKVTKTSATSATVEPTVSGAIVDEELVSVTQQLMLGSDAPPMPPLPEKTDSASGVTCTVTQQKIENNLLTYEIKATGGKGRANGAYQLNVTFAPNIHVTGDENVEEVTWKLSSIEKVNAANKPMATAGNGGT